MNALKLTLIKWSLIPFISLLAAAVAFGGGHRRITNIKAKTAKMAPLVVSPGILKTSPRLFAVPSDPKALEEERAAFAPSESLRMQAETSYQSGDLIGAEAACLQAFSTAPVLHGEKEQLPSVDLLLGRIYLKGGQYKQALYWLQPASQLTGASSLKYDLALAYVKVGDYKNARLLYSDQDIMQYHTESNNVLLQDLPGTDTPNALEASILLAHGQDAYSEARHDDALADFQEAARLAPKNILLAYDCAFLLSEERRFAEATPLFERVAANGHGFLREDAVRRLIGIRAPSGPIKQPKQ